LKILYLALAFLFLSLSAHASDTPAETPTDDATAHEAPATEDLRNPLLTMSGVYIGYRFQYFDYQEPSPNVHQYGPLHGLVVGVDGLLPRTDFFYKIEAEYLTGVLIYDGFYQSGGALEANTEDHTASLRLHFGFIDYLSSNTSLQIYSGLMYRYLYDYVQASGGYRREISQITLPLGITRRQALQNWAYGLTAEIDILASGAVKSHMSDVGPTYSDIENKQSRGYGVKLGADFDLPFRKMVFMIQPTFQYWLMDDSDIATNSHGSFLEPYNISKMYNLSLILKF